ncbi:nuclear transport factor 2 family protein [Sphingomonas sp. C3-2]|uniref:nuclear transport factor 2 family protein n=1 Tax=Sphingomonas sp. C3-2 TaxID=3062169 RepID=UPI00294A9D39|nr:nuclear transport factor 2 family protein [Sphingomonas sp. C3-2]WOK36716.1 nuclear transport factor 2 family protein [Sphingomonas sp. C3-2]
MPDSSQTNENRAILADFVDIFLGQRAIRTAFEKHVHEDYVQHSSGIANGRESAILALEAMFARMGDVKVEVRRVLVDGEHAAVYISGGDVAGGAAYDVVDLFRLQGGKIVEHWDVFAPRRQDGRPVI